jgi:acyl-coenzyme A thioesterase PaaI-like protein
VTGEPREPGLDDYGRMIGALRGFLGGLAGARPPRETVRDIECTLTRWSKELSQFQVNEPEQLFGRQGDLPGRGQTLSPAFEIVDLEPGSQLRAKVRFDRYYLGSNGAVHGGAIPLVFDELLGRVASTLGGAMARTAYLHVNYRSITPVDKDLDVTARLASVAGRKRVVTGEMRDGPVLLSDAEGLFVELKPGQP